MLKLLPQEVETWYVIPAIRRELAKEMRSRGLPQKAIASRLGLTEAAVSQYIHEKRAKELRLSDAILAATKAAVDTILQTGDTYNEILRISQLIKQDTSICDIHKMYDEVPQGCAVCFDQQPQLIMPNSKSGDNIAGRHSGVKG